MDHLDNLLERIKGVWMDGFAIHLATTDFRMLGGQTDLFGDIFKVITIIIPFLSSRKPSDPINLARKQLRKLRKDLKKKKIGETEYNLLRKKVLDRLAVLNF